MGSPYMIELHVSTERTPADRTIEDELVDLVVAHRVVVHDPAATIEVALPAIHESGTWVSAAEFDPFMADLRTTLRQWRMFQSDVCYIDDSGSVC